MAVAIGHHLAHQRGVFGGDIGVVKVLPDFEAHAVGIKVDVLVHVVPADVADDVVDVLQANGARDCIVPDFNVSRQERAGIIPALDESVDRSP